MKRKLIVAVAALAAFVCLAILAGAGIPYLSAWATALVAAGVVLAVGWLVVRAVRRFLWRVGRRLAFSYFLIGVLPIPLVALLLLVIMIVVSGFFMGSRYRAAVNELEGELRTAAEARISASASAIRPGPGGEFSFTTYRAGRKIVGDVRAPETWPAWLGEPHAEGELPPLLEAADGSLAFAALAGDAQSGVLALTSTDASVAVRNRAGVWLEFVTLSSAKSKGVQLTVGTRTYDLKTLHAGGADLGAEAFYGWKKGDSVSKRPLLNWGDLSAPTRHLADGSTPAQSRTAALRASPHALKELLFAGNAEVRTAIWAALIGLAFLLFDIYAVAVAMALYMIFGLSRAVNHLSHATSAVAAGDFSTRIPVKRKDQLGDLQRDFNQMAQHLQGLVATQAQKEAIEKELEIARRVQKSLLPSDPAKSAGPGAGVEFSTHFSPSAAIGGDYFDVLRMADGRLAVVIADVSGHGLSAGLRMAMLKAGLQILIEQGRDPEEILRRLDRLVRSSGEGRAFVTATLALLDPESGRLELINAGHPPTYLLRGGNCEEIALPGSPLGGIGGAYGRSERQLEPGDIAVWLSDGLIEATDQEAEPFGYESVAPAIAGAQSAEDTRDRLLRAVALHCGEQPAEDDQTLVVMQFRPRAVDPAAPVVPIH
ncbi:MAG: SpoIIE family protein phosphatase [Acidobacteriota bacterium]